jgi:hypothetical protein
MRTSIKLCHEEVEYKKTLGTYGKEMVKQNHDNLKVMLNWLMQEDTYPPYEEYKEAFLEQNKYRQWTPEARAEGAIQWLWKHQVGKWKQTMNLKPFQSISEHSTQSHSISPQFTPPITPTTLHKSSSETTENTQRIPEESRESQRNVEATENSLSDEEDEFIQRIKKRSHSSNNSLCKKVPEIDVVTISAAGCAVSEVPAGGSPTVPDTLCTTPDKSKGELPQENVCQRATMKINKPLPKEPKKDTRYNYVFGVDPEALEEFVQGELAEARALGLQ